MHSPSQPFHAPISHLFTHPASRHLLQALCPRRSPISYPLLLHPSFTSTRYPDYSLRRATHPQPVPSSIIIIAGAYSTSPPTRLCVRVSSEYTAPSHPSPAFMHPSAHLLHSHRRSGPEHRSEGRASCSHRAVDHGWDDGWVPTHPVTRFFIMSGWDCLAGSPPSAPIWPPDPERAQVSKSLVNPSLF